MFGINFLTSFFMRRIIMICVTLKDHQWIFNQCDRLSAVVCLCMCGCM